MMYHIDRTPGRSDLLKMIQSSLSTFTFWNMGEKPWNNTLAKKASKVKDRNCSLIYSVRISYYSFQTSDISHYAGALFDY